MRYCLNYNKQGVGSMKPISGKRQEILDFMTDFARNNGYPPTVREICKAVGLSSPSTVHSHLKILEDQGYLSKDARKPRALKLAGAEQFSGIPLLGTVTAGIPITAQEDLIKYIPFDGDVSNHFALLVRGDSMMNAAILSGDIVIVRRQETADHGDIVVALLDDEATVKRLYRQKGKILLMPENDAFDPIPGDECVILGIVKAVFREM